MNTLSEDVPIGWMSIIVDRLDTVESIGNDVMLASGVLIGLTSASDQLNSKWGDYDVEDCQQAAEALATGSFIDGGRVAIRGGSAGAYTSLSSVTFAPDPTYFKTACGAYGCVADIESLTKVMEKFEMRYIYTLMGCDPTGGKWDSRNPIKNVAKLSVPLLVRDMMHLAIMCRPCVHAIPLS